MIFIIQLSKPQSIFYKLIKDKLALCALMVIFLVAIVAIFAYPLATDNTPDANNMILELSARPVSFSKKFLLVPKERVPVQKGFFSRFFLGTPSPNHFVPIENLWQNNDKIYAKHYIDDGLYDTLIYPISKFAIPKSVNALEWLNKHQVMNRTFILGTDRYGRDILSRLFIGARISMAVGIVSVMLSLSIGILLGAIAGWYGGRIDDAVMWIINIFWAIPTLLLVFAITITIGKGFWEIFVAIGLTSWVSTARLIRGQVMQLKEMDYIIAAKALGFNDWRIIFRHIIPNIAGPVMVLGAANFATAILIEAGLSFLGIGVQPPTPSWGLMIKEHYNFLIAGNPLPAIIPGIAIMILVLAFNILGNAFRDAIDVRLD